MPRDAFFYDNTKKKREQVPPSENNDTILANATICYHLLPFGRFCYCLFVHPIERKQQGITGGQRDFLSE